MTIAMVLFLLFSNLKGSDANGHVQKALNAFNVYDNIVKNIDDANITALTALNISSSTNDVSILWYYYFWMINIHYSWYLHKNPGTSKRRVELLDMYKNGEKRNQFL